MAIDTDLDKLVEEPILDANFSGQTSAGSLDATTGCCDTLQGGLRMSISR